MNDRAWELATVVAADETRATAIAASMTRGEPVTLSSLPLVSHTDEIRRAWRERGHEDDPRELESDVVEIFARLGDAVRDALERGEWDWGDHPPASFASWLSAGLLRLRDHDR
jgi:hypothetical protein